VRDDPDIVGPAVLAQALGSHLGPGEEVICARFVRLTGGRLLESSGDGAHVVIVTDRRVVRVTAREWRTAGDTVDPATLKWTRGTPIDRGSLLRRSVWLGQIRHFERRWYWGKDRWLALFITDGREEGVAGRAEAIIALETAIRQVLDGPGRWTLPPPSPPSPVGSWAERLAAVLRPNRRTRD